MKITKIIIKHFKSIESLEFDVKKYGNSYTTMFVGINESGKSNILEAMSFLDTPQKKFSFSNYCNQKEIDKEDYVGIYFKLEFEDKRKYLKLIQENIGKTGKLLDFDIISIEKNVYLGRDDSRFQETYNFDISFLKQLFIKKLDDQLYEVAENQDEENTFLDLTEELFKEYFKDNIVEIIKQSEPPVTFWKPSNDYLISQENLNDFVQNNFSKKALKNIFLLAGYDDEKIKEAISNIPNSSQRSRLTSKLEDSLNKYLNKVWKHKINFVIEITETGQFDLFIKDTGIKNKHDRFTISARSGGAKQFLSLILSLSIESNKNERKNQLILIDEPEAHLHPSGIRDLRNELLEIGKENFVFLSTHSPFLIDSENKERNIIIKKNNNAFTEKREIKQYEDIRDDEVLDEAFGINVYKDLLIPHRMLVEGKTDKIILQKAFKAKGIKDFGITNGSGSNVITLASKLNDADISILVILDDDQEGKNYKNKIIKIGGSFTEENVYTIRDLVGDIKNNGTIEDVLGINFVKSQLEKFYKSKFEKECSIELNKDVPFIEQIKNFLIKKDKDIKNPKEYIDKFKEQISDTFDPAKSTFKKKFPLLNNLVDKILEKLEK